MTEEKSGLARTIPIDVWSSLGVGVTITAAIALAWNNRFVQDTAFVTFQYARSMVEGGGLQWFDQRVEGYTNFLWVFWIALGMEIGVDPVVWSYIGGLTAFVAAGLGVWRIGRVVFEESRTAVAAVVIFASNWSALAFATGGLETMAQTALLCWSAALALQMYYQTDYSSRIPLTLSFLFTMALMVRIDSAVIVAPMILIAVAGAGRAGRDEPGYVALIGPMLVLVAGWMAWRYGYYGRLVPNTFYAWIDPTIAMVGNGVPYVTRFATWYLYWPLAALALIVSIVLKIRMAPRLGMVLVLALAWLMYVVLIGGDFLEFRLIVPVLPFLALGMAWAIEALAIAAGGFGWPVRLIGVGALVAASVVHALSFTGSTTDGTLDSVHLLAIGRGLYPDGSWGRIGSRLGSDLAGTGAVLAAQEPGAIAYFSRLRTIDMWGLNDLEIALEGSRVPSSFTRPGHRRHATLTWLRQIRANFVMGRTTVVAPGTMTDDRNLPQLRAWLEGAIPFNSEALEHAMLVAMPINERESLLMWYLTPTRRITERMRAEEWEMREVRFGE